MDDPPSLHRYFYANDNPTRYVDPTGHFSIEDAKREAREAALFAAMGLQHFGDEAGKTYERAVEGVGKLLVPGATAQDRRAAGQELGPMAKRQMEFLDAARDPNNQAKTRLYAYGEAAQMQPGVVVEEVGLRPLQEAPGHARAAGVHAEQASRATGIVDKTIHALAAVAETAQAFLGFATPAALASGTRGGVVAPEEVLAARQSAVAMRAGEAAADDVVSQGAGRTPLPGPTSGFERYVAAEQRISRLPMTVAEAEDALRMNAGMADLRTRAAGVPRSHGRFGTQTHVDFEATNAPLDQATRGAGSPVSFGLEEFRGSPTSSGGAGAVTSRRAPASGGVDAVVYVNGVPARGFDLKTGRPWTAAELKEIERRFGVPVTQIKTK